MTDPVSSTSFLLSGSSNRMFGLASGLDIDSMVSKLMQAEEVPLDQLKQQQQQLEWKQDDYRSMNSLLLDLYNSTFDMTLQSNYLVKQATSSNDTYVTATASSSSSNTSYTIKSGTMASAAYNSSTADIVTSAIDPSESLWANRKSFTNNPFTTFTSNYVNGETVSAQADGTYKLKYGLVVDSNSSDANFVAPTISDASGSYQVYFSKDSYDTDNAADTANPPAKRVLIDPTTGALTFNQTPTGTITANYTYATGTSFDVTLTTPDDNGVAQTVTKSFDGTKSLNDVMDTINASTAGVTMYYDSNAKRVSIVRNKTGDYLSGNEMTFSGNFLTQTLELNGTEGGGQDCKVNINGLATQYHENTFTINGVTFNLKADIPAGTIITVGITNDSSGIFDKIKSWVDKYNDTIQKINDKISQKKYRDYPPLTDAQKKSMSDSDIKLWNDKAMSGMLSDDTLLPGGLDQMRMDIYSSVNSVTNTDSNQLADIGITTSSEYTDNGKLVIDEAKLKAAIAADPTSVMNLFTNTGIPSGGTKPVYANEGIMMRLQSTIQNTMDSIYQEAGKDTYTYDQFSLGKSIHDYDNQISDMMDHLKDVQNRYYSQFTAMEQAIQQANQQGSFISQNFAG